MNKNVPRTGLTAEMPTRLPRSSINESLSKRPANDAPSSKEPGMDFLMLQGLSLLNYIMRGFPRDGVRPAEAWSGRSRHVKVIFM